MDWFELTLLYGGMSLLAVSPVLGRKKHTRVSISLCIIAILMLIAAYIYRSI
ncbi:uncharacterized protein METZ01_LOCUS479453 [marine metagenome]|uniref:Uncharacterized protein n=1 Tax=marine metagenome TaxID=408172 RepID=A0A383C3H7_9ZZZZ